MKNVLITGGLGFVGTNLTDHLLKSDPSLQVTLLDSLALPHAAENNYRHLKSTHGSQVKLLPGDITDRGQVNSAFLHGSIDTVVHLAAIGSNWRALKDPSLTHAVNIDGTINVFESARSYGVETFYQQSTIEVYGDHKAGFQAFDENSPLNPNTPYSETKAMAEDYVSQRARESGMKTIIGRPTNLYGRRQHPDAFIASFIRRALIGRPLIIFGDGLQTRQLTHIDDYSRAVEMLLKEGGTQGLHNIGSEDAESVISMAQKVLAIAGKAPEGNIRLAGERPRDDHDYLFISSQKLRELGWAQQTYLPDGLAETFQWYRRNKTAAELKHEDMEFLAMRHATLSRELPKQGILPLDNTSGRRK